MFPRSVAQQDQYPNGRRGINNPITTQPVSRVQQNNAVASVSTNWAGQTVTAPLPTFFNILRSMSKITIQEKVRVTGENHYRIFNERGEDILLAKGHPDWFKSLSLTIHEGDKNGREILRVETETDILHQKMDVQCPPGQTLAIFERESTCCKPSKFIAKTPDGAKMFDAVSPQGIVICSLFQDRLYKVFGTESDVPEATMSIIFQLCVTGDKLLIRFNNQLDLKDKIILMTMMIMMHLSLNSTKAEEVE